MVQRRSARNQSLPGDEAEHLQSLSNNALRQRCRRLYEAGWTLSAIGDPLGRQRSTIRFWITNAVEVGEDLRPLPMPVDKTYIHKKAKSPGLTSDERDAIRHMAPIARKYRAKLSHDHPATTANRDLTQLCVTLHSSGIPLQELADAAGVTYRAMYRRVRS